ncbi:MAG: NAD-dependent epimerase/dehydratase family protein [Bauldia sp.]
MTPRALVAGGAGFIGSNLCASLLDRGYSVVAIDNFSTGRPDNIRPLQALAGFDFIYGDVADAGLTETLAMQRFDEVYNLACPTGVPNIAILGDEMLRTSSIGSLNLLELARTTGALYLFTSTAEVYGEAEVVPQPETYTGNVDPVGDRSPYEEGKRFGEALAMRYARRHGVDVRIIRVFNTYGVGMSPDDRRVIPQLLLSALHGEPFTVYGDGSQTRSFLYVSDLLDGFRVAIERGVSGDVFNIGSSRERTILDLHRAAEAALGRRIEIAFKPHFIRDHLRRCPDTTRIGSLGWKPKVDLADGLRRSFADVVGRGGNEPAASVEPWPAIAADRQRVDV